MATDDRSGKACGNAAPVTIVIVDDDPLVRSALDSLLRSAGYATLRYSSAAEALATPWPETAACLVTDVSMPQLGGFGFIAALAERGIGLPVILMSGHSDAAIEARAHAAGAVACLGKPFTDHTMLAAITAALARPAAAGMAQA